MLPTAPNQYSLWIFLGSTARKESILCKPLVVSNHTFHLKLALIAYTVYISKTSKPSKFKAFSISMVTGLKVCHALSLKLAISCNGH